MNLTTSRSIDKCVINAIIYRLMLGVMRPGMVFTIEPCISEGDRRVRTLEDGWTAVTLVSLMRNLLIFVIFYCLQDNSRTAQVEHTVVITERGAEILTE